jgi:hypothetical protein
MLQTQVARPSQEAQRLQPVFEDLFHVATPVENGNYLQRIRAGPVDNQIRIDRKKPHLLTGQILARMSRAGISSQKNDLVQNHGLNVVRYFDGALFLFVS